MKYITMLIKINKVKREKLIIILILAVALLFRIHATNFTKEVIDDSDGAAYKLCSKEFAAKWCTCI